MMTQPLTIVLAIICIFGLVLSGFLLIKRGWVLSWLRGMIGLVFLATATFCIFTVVELRAYKELLVDESIGKISFTKISPQTFRASLQLEDMKRSYVLKGDQWQIDARIIRWKGPLKTWSKPAYMLDRIGGRYTSVADETTAERTVYSLHKDKPVLDIWSLANKNSEDAFWVDAAYGNATFVPMADNAVYDVVITAAGLAARPDNKIASEAVDLWPLAD